MLLWYWLRLLYLLRLLKIHPLKKRRTHRHHPILRTQIQFQIHWLLSILKQLNQTYRHGEFRFVECIVGGVLIGHGPYCFEEIDGQFGEGEEFDGGGAGEVACAGFVGCGEEGIVVGLLTEIFG